jgi:hypothetical protein
MTVKTTAGNTVRLYYGGPLWEVLRICPVGAGSAYVICVRKHGRREMAIYRVCDLVLVNAGPSVVQSKHTVQASMEIFLDMPGHILTTSISHLPIAG